MRASPSSSSSSTSTSTSTSAASGLKARLKRGELLSKDCPSRGVLMHVTSRWGVLLLVVLLDGTHRFSDLRRKVGGVSEKMLAQTLQALEADGFVERRSFPVVPPHVEYTLTDMGVEVARKVESLADWIESNMARIMKVRPRVAAAAARHAKHAPPTAVGKAEVAVTGAVTARA